MNRTVQLGYTLIELMVVLAITSILTASAFSGWQQWQQNQRLEESARQVQQFLSRVRAWANWHNSGQGLWLIEGENSCLGSGLRPAAGCAPAHRLQLQLTHPDVAITKMVGEPGFYGLRNAAKPGHIEIASAGGKRRIIISAFGRIRRCNPQQEGCL